MIFGARAATILAVVGLACNVFNSVAAFPLEVAGKAQVVTSCTKPQTAALTFDDGPYTWTRDAMNILEANGAKGTFFVNGKNWGCIYDQDKVDILKEVYKRGHQIGSHTWSHPHLNSLNKSQVQSELMRTKVAIQRITGADVAFMRPPYGEFNDNVREVASDLKETVVIWDVDSKDSIPNTSVQTQKDQYTNAVKNKMPSVLSLQHDVHETSIKQVLPFAIKTLKDAGYKLVTVAECLGEQPYHSTGQAQSRTSDWYC